MASSNPAVSVVSAVRAAVSAIPKPNPARRKKPSPLPLRPLRPDRFRPPRGQKQIFLPNFVLTFIRPPRHQPANFASFFTPLWMNKLDLKDYLYHLYGVEALYIRSYIAHGRVIRDSGSGRLVRTSQKKKMTIEMKTGDNFVWPDVPEDLEPWNKRVEQALEKEKEAQKEGRSQQGQELGRVGDEDRTSLREKARALLEGKVKWRPGWQEHGVGMGPLGAEAKPGASL